MRSITVPCPDWDKLVGARAVIPVKVDWPELRLTENQIVANAIARAAGGDHPFPDRSFIEVIIERPTA